MNKTYEIKSLTDCGSITNYELVPPITEHSEYNNYKDYNRVKLINTMRNKYSLTIYGIKQFENIEIQPPKSPFSGKIYGGEFLHHFLRVIM